MTLVTIPDAEAVIGSYLREHPDIAALNARVAGTLPGAQSEQVAPWVRLTQLAATDVGGVERLIDYLVQFDCYAGATATRDYVGQAAASTLARTVRAVLKAVQGETYGGVVITSVGFQSMVRLPDTDFEPARERFVLTAAIHCHAA